MNLAGIKRILELEYENRALRGKLEGLADELRLAQAKLRSSGRVFAAEPGGDIVAVPPGRRPQRPVTSTALVVWRPSR